MYAAIIENATAIIIGRNRKAPRPGDSASALGMLPNGNLASGLTSIERTTFRAVVSMMLTLSEFAFAT